MDMTEPSSVDSVSSDLYSKRIRTVCDRKKHDRCLQKESSDYFDFFFEITKCMTTMMPRKCEWKSINSVRYTLHVSSCFDDIKMFIDKRNLCVNNNRLAGTPKTKRKRRKRQSENSSDPVREYFTISSCLLLPRPEKHMRRDSGFCNA